MSHDNAHGLQSDKLSDFAHLTVNQGSLLHQLATLWNRLWTASLALSSAAIALLLVVAIAQIFALDIWAIVSLWLVLWSVIFVLSFIVGRHRLATAQRIAEHLNRIVPELEESAQLLLKPLSECSLVEAMQMKRVQEKVRALQIASILPNPLRHAWKLSAASILCALLLLWLVPKGQTSEESAVQQVAVSSNNILSPLITRVQVKLLPPRYTGRVPVTQSSLDLNAFEHTQAHWMMELSAQARAARFIFNDRDTLHCLAQDGTFQAQTTLWSSGFYVLEIETEQGVERSQYHKISLVRDEPPAIEILEPNQRAEVDVLKQSRLKVLAKIHDDFAVPHAQLQATLAQGKGENVRFKTLMLNFDEHTHTEHYAKTLDVLALGLQPGDELYLTIEAHDNREPKPNRSRSETIFIAIKDTAEVETDFSMSLPVAAQPDYFRSQRQIIMDTEKLLRERKTLSVADFQARSEALGVEQKVLRLRYGKFLGEEFESAIGGSDIEEIEKELVPKDSAPHPLLKFVRHVHDENCGHLSQHSIAALEKNPNDATVEKLMSQFVHKHDSEEGATFYSDAIKAELKAALAEMWDAELYLRMHKPEEALPYELKALKLLKDLQQKSRMYVQRMGFEPPTLKPDEKRLTGKLEKVASRTDTRTVALPDEYADVRQALATAMKLRSGQAHVTGQALRQLERGATALVHAAENEPLRYLHALQALRRFLDEAERQGSARLSHLEPVERAWLELLPDAEARPEALPSPYSLLAKSYFQQLTLTP